MTGIEDVFDSTIFYKVPTNDYNHIKFPIPSLNIDGPAVLDNSQDIAVITDCSVKTTTVIDSATGNKIGGTVEIESDWPIPEDECQRICDEVIAGM